MDFKTFIKKEMQKIISKVRVSDGSFFFRYFYNSYYEIKSERRAKNEQTD